MAAPLSFLPAVHGSRAPLPRAKRPSMRSSSVVKIYKHCRTTQTRRESPGISPCRTFKSGAGNASEKAKHGANARRAKAYIQHKSMNGSYVRGFIPHAKYKNRCPKCASYNYKIVFAFYKKETRFVTRQCENCFNEWDVASRSEYIAFKFSQTNTSSREDNP